LRDDGSHDFHVDGYHKTLVQVELPPWLHSDIVQKLTRKFERYLVVQIRTLMANHRQRTINPSGQSAHDFSSDSSGGEEDGSNDVQYGGEADFASLKLIIAQSRSRRQRRSMDSRSFSGPI